MLDFFYILTKGGLVLWCVPSASSEFVRTINDAIDKALLQGQGGKQKWVDPLNSRNIHYKLDNEFELVFILGYQKTLCLSYADKFLDEIQKRFRDQYKEDLIIGGFSRSFRQFRRTYWETLKAIEDEDEKSKREHRAQKKYEDTTKFNRTIKIATKKSDATDEKNHKKNKSSTKNKHEDKQITPDTAINNGDQEHVDIADTKEDPASATDLETHIENTAEEPAADDLQSPQSLMNPTSIEQKMLALKKRPAPFSKTATSRSPKPEKPTKKKTPQLWSKENPDPGNLDYTSKNDTASAGNARPGGTVAAPSDRGGLKALTIEGGSVASTLATNFWEKLKKVNVFASKTLTNEDIQIGMETMREHLIVRHRVFNNWEI
ncbi:unnamed protein product [Didymodactylos carnosus]|uniref:Signal recognition particle receptor alpha subunit N-terminal domain-containing protein n=2 Tax=Didymodactylos carnosus TaxID=1234261 RepID=A0A8S2HXA4_9BILA|nr:unnamed protein product [Didymodactylos carnosus]CAF3687446.1 unnamed protein product [Didymodactylos carnosus]